MMPSGSQIFVQKFFHSLKILRFNKAISIEKKLKLYEKLVKEFTFNQADTDLKIKLFKILFTFFLGLVRQIIFI